MQGYDGLNSGQRVVKRKKFKPPVKSDDQKLPTVAQSCGKVQAVPEESNLCRQETSKENDAADVALEEEQLLHQSGHTLLSYCDDTAITAAESDSDRDYKDNGECGIPRRDFKRARSEACVYNYSILQNSKKIRSIQRKYPISCYTKNFIANTTAFEFLESQVHNSQQTREHSTSASIKQREAEIARDREVLQIIASTEQEILRIRERYTSLKSALLLGSVYASEEDARQHQSEE